MTDKDKEAFEGVYGAITDNDGRANHFQQLKFEAFTAGLIAARAESAKELAEKDAEIERLKQAVAIRALSDNGYKVVRK
jgi:hypothetical protein